MAKCAQCGKSFCRDPHHRVANAQTNVTRNDRKIAAHDAKTEKLRSSQGQHKTYTQAELREIQRKFPGSIDEAKRADDGTFMILWKRGKKPNGYS